MSVNDGQQWKSTTDSLSKNLEMYSHDCCGSRMVKLPFWKMRSSQICRFRLTGVSIRFTDVLKTILNAQKKAGKTKTKGRYRASLLGKPYHHICAPVTRIWWMFFIKTVSLCNLKKVIYSRLLGRAQCSGERGHGMYCSQNNVDLS